MIQAQLKLRLNTKQEAQLTGWLCNLTGVWNWAVRKMELNAKDKIYFSKHEFQNLLANHGEKMEIPSHTLQGILSQAHLSWTRCFKKLAKKPRLKGQRNKLNSIPFPDPIRRPVGNSIAVPGLGKVRFHRQEDSRRARLNAGALSSALAVGICACSSQQTANLSSALPTVGLVLTPDSRRCSLCQMVKW